MNKLGDQLVIHNTTVCAPRHSLRAAAEINVAFATSYKFSTSSASTRAVLNTLDLSFKWMLRTRGSRARISLTPYQVKLEYGIHLRDLERYHELHQQLLERFHQ